MRAKKITVKEVEYTAFLLAQELMTYNEPIPDFGTRFPNILESCINTPFAHYKKDLYRGLVEKASTLFYLCIKNHPFQNGNKRIAVMILLYFLYKNSKWLKMDQMDLYNFAKRIAKSTPPSRGKITNHIRAMIKKYLIDFDGI